MARVSIRGGSVWVLFLSLEFRSVQIPKDN